MTPEKDASRAADFEEYEQLENGGVRGPPRRRGTRSQSRRKSNGDSYEGHEGTVVSRSRGRYRVAVGRRVVPCTLRGRLRGLEAPVVGDRVRIVIDEDGDRGVLEDVLPRRNALSRVSEEGDGESRVIAANIDRLVIVLSVEPYPPRWVLADRLLVLSEREGFEPVIAINKVDLIKECTEKSAARLGSIREAAAVYVGLGIPVIFSSALEKIGIDELEAVLKDRTSLFCGHSGVGKSSLLNAFHPDLNLAVQSVNPHTGRGRHTTTLARLVALPFGGYLVDTPGFREFGLGDVAPADLGRFYPEFRPIIGQCRFSDCLHRSEPQCALRRAVEHGEVSNLRYQNYLQILSGLVEMDR